jgi:serine/threonine protein phosphatase PrpC
MTIQQILPCGYSAKKSVNSSNWIKCASDQYQGQRDYNEDRILLSVGIKILGKVFNFFGVFDGHGGSAASEYSKTNFIKLFE